MTPTKSREVTKIWVALQMVTDKFWGGGVSFFHHM